jgi:hypothetical protein
MGFIVNLPLVLIAWLLGERLGQNGTDTLEPKWLRRFEVEQCITALQRQIFQNSFGNPQLSFAICRALRTIAPLTKNQPDAANDCSINEKNPADYSRLFDQPVNRQRLKPTYYC